MHDSWVPLVDPRARRPAALVPNEDFDVHRHPTVRPVGTSAHRAPKPPALGTDRQQRSVTGFEDTHPRRRPIFCSPGTHLHRLTHPAHATHLARRPSFTRRSSASTNAVRSNQPSGGLHACSRAASVVPSVLAAACVYALGTPRVAPWALCRPAPGACHPDLTVRLLHEDLAAPTGTLHAPNLLALAHTSPLPCSSFPSWRAAHFSGAGGRPPVDF